MSPTDSGTRPKKQGTTTTRTRVGRLTTCVSARSRYLPLLTIYECVLDSPVCMCVGRNPYYSWRFCRSRRLGTTTPPTVSEHPLRRLLLYQVLPLDKTVEVPAVPEFRKPEVRQSDVLYSLPLLCGSSPADGRVTSSHSVCRRTHLRTSSGDLRLILFLPSFDFHSFGCTYRIWLTIWGVVYTK